MLKKITTIVLLFVLTTIEVFSQDTTSNLKGKINNEEGKPLESLTVSLISAKDSSKIKSTITNKSGHFSFDQLKYDSYLVSISGVGFQNKFSNPIEISKEKNQVTLSPITLLAKTKDLQAVNVVSKKPFIENKIDKTIVNVEASQTSTGLTALELLEKSPGITVDNDGNISVKGKSGVIILVDGKSTFLSGTDLSNYLKNLSANQLEQIEIMTQPSAKYDASGNSGIINFKTKKNKAGGFNGSFNTSAIFANYFKNTNSLNLNYKKNKVNVFANLGYSRWIGFTDINITRSFRRDNKTNSNRFYEQTTFGKFFSYPLDTKLGIDYNISKKVTIGLVFNNSIAKQRFRADGINNIYDSSHILAGFNSSVSESKDPTKNFGTNLNFKYNSTKGDELTADADYIQYRNQSIQFSDNYLYNGDHMLNEEPYLLNGFLPSNIDIYSFKSDYSRTLKHDLKFEAGIKSSYVTTDNDAQYTRYDSTQHQWLKDNGRSNHFIYTENINAAYINLNKQFKKWGVQLGLRAEQTISKGHQEVDNSDFTKNYIELFPTIYTSYKVNDSNTFAISYGRRIQRPGYADLNPFQYLLDRYSYQQGNPLLQPQFSNNIELSYNYKGQLNVALNYTTTDGVINTVLKTEKSGDNYITYATKANIASRKNAGLAISYNRPIRKWWSTNFSFNVYNNIYNGIVDNEPINVSYASFNTNISNQFTFKNGWTGELSGFYNYKNLVSSVILARPMGMFSLGVGKQILKNKGSVKLNLRDPLWLMKFNGYTAMDKYSTTFINKWDNRRLVISFSYRFGKASGQQSKKRSATEEEENRVGKNNNG